MTKNNSNKPDNPKKDEPIPDPRIKYLTCLNCSSPLSDNQLVKDAYKLNTVLNWAKGRLSILLDMLEYNNKKQTPINQEWLEQDLKKILGSIINLNLKY